MGTLKRPVGGIPLRDYTPTEITGIKGELGIAGRLNLSPYHFGAFGNGVEDDTASVQDWASYISNNGILSDPGPGKFRVFDTINFAAKPGWGISGAGQVSYGNGTGTEFIQATPGIKVFDFGGGANSDIMHSVVHENYSIKYENHAEQNTGAVPWYFSAMAYGWDVRNVSFANGHYAIKISPGVGAPWGCLWESMVFGGGLTGGAIDWTGSVFGTPNNRWTNFRVHCQSMKDTIFKQIIGYNFSIDCVEMLGASNIPWFDFASGSDVNIGQIKMEVAHYDAAISGSMYLIAATASALQIGSIHIGGTHCVLSPPSGSLYILSGGDGRIVDVGMLTMIPTQSVQNSYVSACVGDCSIKKIVNQTAHSVPYTNYGSSAAAQTLSVLDDIRGRLSSDVGDANYAALPGSPNVISFETALTANRTVTVTSSESQWFNGLWYAVRADGIVNAAHTITMTVGGLSFVLPAGGKYMKILCRRGSWVVEHSA